MALWLNTITVESRTVAVLHAQLLEKDRQIAALQYQTGTASLKMNQTLLDIDATLAQCQLLARAVPITQRLQELDNPATGLVWDFSSGTWVPRKDSK